jgi:hypothetical protein
MNKLILICTAIAIVAASVALIAYSQNQAGLPANNFSIEVNNYNNEYNTNEYYYSVWYTGSQTLTNVYVLFNGVLVQQWDVFVPSRINSIFHWVLTGNTNRAATVEIQWNNGRTVLTYQP